VLWLAQPAAWTSRAGIAIAAQSIAPGSSVSLVCRMHGISTRQLYTWRKQFRLGELTGFVPVSVTADAAPPSPAAEPDVTDDLPTAVGVIEIELPSGVKAPRSDAY
jgi:transposase